MLCILIVSTCHAPPESFSTTNGLSMPDPLVLLLRSPSHRGKEYGPSAAGDIGNNPALNSQHKLPPIQEWPKKLEEKG